MNSETLESYRGLLAPEKMPVHVAIIMDGNGRWASKRMLGRLKGHEKGAESVRRIAEICGNLGIPYLTLYAFSTENWQRPQKEVDSLMKLLKKFLQTEEKRMMQNNIRLRAIGEAHRLPDDVRYALKDTIARTSRNEGLHLTLALSYGGRAEIRDAMRKIAQKACSGKLKPEEINFELIAAHMYTHDLPDPDLLIRTSGEMRISNFLLWQIAYSEIYVTNTLWPDFKEAEFVEILKEYQRRERRFGQVKP